MEELQRIALDLNDLTDATATPGSLEKEWPQLRARVNEISTATYEAMDVIARSKQDKAPKSLKWTILKWLGVTQLNSSRRACHCLYGWTCYASDSGIRGYTVSID